MMCPDQMFVNVHNDMKLISCLIELDSHPRGYQFDTILILLLSLLALTNLFHSPQPKGAFDHLINLLESCPL